jgi:hypothetical protein
LPGWSPEHETLILTFSQWEKELSPFERDGREAPVRAVELV